MKILLLSDSLGAGGAQRQLCGLAVMLKNAGYEVCVVYYHGDDFYKEYLVKNEVSNNLLQDSKGVIKRICSVRKFIKSYAPQWVIAYLETPSLLASLSRISGINFRLLVSERNTTQRMMLKDRIRFFLYRWADSIVPNSYTQEQFLINRYKWMSSKMTTISNFVDLNHFNYIEKSRNDHPLIVVAATSWPPKNTIGFIEAVNILKNRDVKFRVQWFGYSSANQEYFNDAMSLIRQYRLNDYVELLPKTKEIKKAYSMCDYFCLPSFYEGVPNVIGEAMSTGRPIICSSVCDNTRFVHEGENGFLFDPNCPESLATAIESALAISDMRYLQMCKKSRDLAVKLLSKRAFLDKYIEILTK